MKQDLPRGWRMARLDKVCEFNPKHSKDISKDIQVSFVPMPAVDVTGILLPHGARPLADVWSGYTHFADGDVLFAKITPCMENGKIAVARNLVNGIGCGTTEFHVLRSKGEINAEYLQRYLRQSVFRSDAERSMTGAVGQRRVPANFLKCTEIPLPPPSVQLEIVEKLDYFMNRIERTRRELMRSIELVDRYRRAAINCAFSGSLTTVWRNEQKAAGKYKAAKTFFDDMRSHLESDATSTKRARTALQRHVVPFTKDEQRSMFDLPSDWCWVKLGALASLITKGASPKWQGFDYVSDPTQVLFITSENVRVNAIDVSQPKYLENAFSDKQKASVLRRGDVLINIVGASIGRAAPFELAANANINQAVALCRLIRPELSKYISTFLNSDFAKDFYNSNKVDVARANLSLEDVGNIPIPLSGEQEVAEVVSQVEYRLAVSDGMLQKMEECLSLLDVLEARILKNAFEGKFSIERSESLDDGRVQALARK